MALLVSQGTNGAKTSCTTPAIAAPRRTPSARSRYIGRRRSCSGARRFPSSRTYSPAATHYLPLTDQQLRERELLTAEAALAEMLRVLDAARADLGEANRTHTVPIMMCDRVLMAALRFSTERMRERKSYAIRAGRFPAQEARAGLRPPFRA